MSQFESFIQLELPKRPYLETDADPESVIIRRGPGPRQLSGLTLAEGQTLALVDGKLKAVPYGGGSGGGGSNVDGVSHVQEQASQTWTISHFKANRNVVVTLLDSEYSEIICDDMTVGDNEIVITFVESQSGYANIVFL